MISTHKLQDQIFTQGDNAFPALAIRKKVQQQVFAVVICQFEGILTAKI